MQVTYAVLTKDRTSASKLWEHFIITPLQTIERCQNIENTQILKMSFIQMMIQHPGKSSDLIHCINVHAAIETTSCHCWMFQRVAPIWWRESGCFIFTHYVRDSLYKSHPQIAATDCKKREIATTDQYCNGMRWKFRIINFLFAFFNDIASI